MIQFERVKQDWEENGKETWNEEHLENCCF